MNQIVRLELADCTIIKEHVGIENVSMKNPPTKKQYKTNHMIIIITDDSLASFDN